MRSASETTMKETRISAKLVCKVYETNAKKDQWIGVCEELGLSVQASNLDTLRSVFEEAMILLITDLVEDGELDEFLRAKGFDSFDIPNIQRQVRQQEPVIPWKMSAEFNSDARQKAIA